MKIFRYCILAAALLLIACTAFTSCLKGGHLQTITVTPADVYIVRGTNQQFAATAIFSDGTILNWTAASNWTGDPGVIINDSGLVTEATNTGIFIITATDTVNNIAGTATLHVSDPSSIIVEPNPSVPYIGTGETHMFQATALFSNLTPTGTQNLTSFATWTTDPLVGYATVNSTGLVSAGTATGLTIIKAFAPLSGKGETSITVTAKPLLSILIDPSDPFLSTNAQLQFTGKGTFEDGLETPYLKSWSWSSSDPSIATIDNSGLATAIVPDQPIEIYATDPLSKRTGTTTLTVTN